MRRSVLVELNFVTTALHYVVILKSTATKNLFVLFSFRSKADPSHGLRMTHQLNRMLH